MPDDTSESDVDDTKDVDDDAADADADHPDGDDGEQHDYADKSDTDVYVDRDKIDFDPDDGLLSGTAIEGGTEIPGPHESVDDVMPDDEDGDSEHSGGSGDDDSAADGSDAKDEQEAGE